jgi:hypothetical protein
LIVLLKSSQYAQCLVYENKIACTAAAVDELCCHKSVPACQHYWKTEMAPHNVGVSTCLLHAITPCMMHGLSEASKIATYFQLPCNVGVCTDKNYGGQEPPISE